MQKTARMMTTSITATANSRLMRYVSTALRPPSGGPAPLPVRESAAGPPRRPSPALRASGGWRRQMVESVAVGVTVRVT
ncbi:hypothetical protein TPA0909_62800 [Streptomyces albus]|nr:hypothetical protein TPA0909_62800 [Streptomyces albus]